MDRYAACVCMRHVCALVGVCVGVGRRVRVWEGVLGERVCGYYIVEGVKYMGI